MLVSDVATVSPGVEPQYTIVTADGHPAALVNINRQPDANTVAVVDNVKAALNAMRGQIPKDVRVAAYYDQSLLVRDSIKSVRDSILIGLLLSVVILYAFLRNWGTTFVAILVIPVTMLVTFLAMWLAGLSFDLMTLGGVAAAIGLVIDDAIVVVENIYTHMSRGQSRREAVQSAVSEITVPIIGSTITPVVVFLPLTLLTGVTGVFFRSLALTMAVALLTSLVLALRSLPCWPNDSSERNRATDSATMKTKRLTAEFSARSSGVTKPCWVSRSINDGSSGSRSSWCWRVRMRFTTRSALSFCLSSTRALSYSTISRRPVRRSRKPIACSSTSKSC